MLKENIQDHYKEIEHTADIALEIWAKDFPGLLIQAGWGMLHLMGTETDQLPKDEKLTVVFSFTQHEDVLVQALNEILFQLEANDLIFIPQALLLNDHSAQVEYLGGKTDLLLTEIKAVTYHQMQIVEDKKGLRTIIVFDV
ncbi:MAG: archease [Anaerolineaceae bacterium]|nr:archease [Anaerolineaceae bacterium]